MRRQLELTRRRTKGWGKWNTNNAIYEKACNRNINLITNPVFNFRFNTDTVNVHFVLEIIYTRIFTACKYTNNFLVFIHYALKISNTLDILRRHWEISASFVSNGAFILSNCVESVVPVHTVHTRIKIHDIFPGSCWYLNRMLGFISKANFTKSRITITTTTTTTTTNNTRQSPLLHACAYEAGKWQS